MVATAGKARAACDDFQHRLGQRHHMLTAHLEALRRDAPHAPCKVKLTAPIPRPTPAGRAHLRLVTSTPGPHRPAGDRHTITVDGIMIPAPELPIERGLRG